MALGIGLLRYFWPKTKQLLEYGLYLGNSRFKSVEWRDQKDDLTKLIRFYYIIMGFGLCLILAAIYILKVLIYG